MHWNFYARSFIDYIVQKDIKKKKAFFFLRLKNCFLLRTDLFLFSIWRINQFSF